ncbi:MAG: hypothetical protein ACFHU9_04000 [Fluviicola sp.]
MALAFLKYQGAANGHQEFQADLGGNSYFRIMIGDRRTYRSYGVPVLERKSFVSKMYGPIPAPKLGRIRFRVPQEVFSLENAYVQIVSYREADGTGPAISSIVRTMPGVSSQPLPSIQFAMETNSLNKEIHSVPFQYKESGMSEAMFLDKVMKFLPKVLPAVGQLISGGGNGGSSGGTTETSTDGGTGSNSGTSGGTGGGLGQQILNLISDPEKLQQVIDLLKGVSGGETPTQASAQQLSSGNYSGAMMDPMTIMALVGAVTDGLAKLGKIGAQINKDELDALQKLNPGVDDKDVQGLLNQMSVLQYSGAMMDPTAIMKLVGVVTDGLAKLGKIGAQINKDELDALQKLNPGVDDKDVQGLLNQMGVESSYFQRIKFQKSNLVRIEVAEIEKSILNGDTHYVYGYGIEMKIPVKLHTPRDIPRGIFEIIVRRKDSSEVVIRHRQRHQGSRGGIFEMHPTIPAHLADDLVSGESYDLYLAVLWKGKRNKKFGSCIDIPIAVATEYAFDRIGESKHVVALNDIELHRPFWHKVWQADFTNDTVRYEFECKYYYAIEADRRANAQMETVEFLEPARPRKMEGKMKSGLILSPEVLNDLLPTIGGESLSIDQLEALKTDAFIKQQHRAARSGLKYKGRDGEAAALWVYPEMVLREIILKKTANITPYGTIAGFEEEKVVFPIPELAHFVGVQSNNEI